MPFEKKQRFCRPFDGSRFFKPTGIPMRGLDILQLERDELEAIHLCDFEGMNQTEASEQMKVSTGTLQRLLYSGRKKVADALFSSKALQILDHEHIASATQILGRGYCRRRIQQ
ncbi:MAG: DUF134 domain-containing protein [Candidatus Nanoarchaeia archaeon]|nr:DUF134 domain-containing protein [Candidatus Nanoarchaeia archaeon]